MRNKNYPRIGICCGILSIIFAIVLFAGGGASVKDMDTGTYTSYSYYGGDAYTGIQQAAADTSRNVRSLASIVKTGFQGVSGTGMGYLLLIIGIWLIAHSLHTLNEMEVRNQFEAQILSLLGYNSSGTETEFDLQEETEEIAEVPEPEGDFKTDSGIPENAIEHAPEEPEQESDPEQEEGQPGL